MELAHRLSTSMEPMRASPQHRVAQAAAVALLMIIVPASWSQETAGGPDYERCRYVAIEEAKTRSVANLTGLGILRTWSARHPIAADQELVGAVAYWSPAREDVIRTGLGLGPRHVPESESRGGAESSAEPESESEPSPGGRTQSKALMDAADF